MPAIENGIRQESQQKVYNNQCTVPSILTTTPCTPREHLQLQIKLINNLNTLHLRFRIGPSRIRRRRRNRRFAPPNAFRPGRNSMLAFAADTHHNAGHADCRRIWSADAVLAARKLACSLQPRRCACICKTIRSSERRGFIHRREAEVGQSERDALCHPYSLQTPNPAPQSGGLHLRATSNKTPPAALFAVKRRPEPSLIPSSPSLPIRAF